MNMLVSASALVLACAVLVGCDWITYRQMLVRQLSVEAQIAGYNCISALIFNDPASARKTLEAINAAPRVFSAVVYGPNGETFADFERSAAVHRIDLAPMLHGVVESYQFGDRELDLERRIDFQGRPVGTIAIRYGLEEIRTRLERYGIILAVVLGVSLGVAFAASVFFRRAISEPILRLADIARAVSRDRDYSIRSAPTQSADELGVLTDSFNAMLEQVQESDAAQRRSADDLRRVSEQRAVALSEVQQLNRELEDRVAERTAQLNTSNTKLQAEVEERRWAADEIRKLNEGLEIRNADLATANRELEAFSYSVSHDLRAPLRQVNGFANVLLDGYGADLDPAAKRYLGLICDGARHMGQLVDDLIHLARIGRQELACKPTDLNTLLRSVVSEVQPAGRDVEWRIASLPTVKCDAGLMRQVFVNLLSNAVKYTRRKEKAIIEVGQAQKEGAEVIFVRDNGAGFDQKYAHKLFGVFQRLHRSDEFEGTGVGLAIVDRIIQKHGGRIWAEGESDRGATFSFALPT